MSYRPITDMWILARAKLKPYPDGSKRSYYGAYLGGFLSRARVLLGCNTYDPLLHVCGGMAKHYPYKGGFGPNDKTLDLNPACEPDFLQDAREPFPLQAGGELWRALLADPPYSEAEAANYATGAEKYPKPNLLLANAVKALQPGGRVGIIGYILPRPPDEVKFIACIGIISGFNNRVRCFSVFQKES